jgi:hypothetical protein
MQDGTPDDAASAVDGPSFAFDADAADGGVNPFGVGHWNPVPGLACSILLAADPNASVPPFIWAPCASGRAGCQRFDARWPSPSQRKLGFTAWEAVRLVNGVPIMRDVRGYSNNPYQPQADVTVVERLSGERLFAIGGFYDNNYCGGLSAVGERGIALAFAYGALPNTGYYMMWSTWSAPNALSFKRHTLSDFGLDPTQGAMNDGTIGSGSMFLELKAPDSVGIYDPVQDRFVPTSPRLVGEGPRAVSDGALAFDFNATYGVDLVRPDGSWGNVIVPSAPPPRRVSAFGIDRTNAQQLAWVESDYGNSWSNSVIWTSPYGTSTTAIVPRKVAALPDVTGGGGLYMVTNAGVVLNLIDKNKALLTRLSDGMGWLVTAEAGDAFTEPLWVDDNEVWIAIGPGSDPNWQATLTGMVRFTRASLGSPSVTPGL